MDSEPFGDVFDVHTLLSEKPRFGHLGVRRTRRPASFPAMDRAGPARGALGAEPPLSALLTCFHGSTTQDLDVRWADFRALGAFSRAEPAAVRLYEPFLEPSSRLVQDRVDRVLRLRQGNASPSRVLFGK